LINAIAERLGRVSDRMRAEEALRQSEARYRAVTQSANDAIITTDDTGNIVSWNRGAEKIFGYTEAEISGQSLDRLIPQRYREPHLAGMKRVQAGGEQHIIGKTVELEGLRKDMSEFSLELSLAQWETAEGQFYTAIIRDISERKRLQENLEYFAGHDTLTGLLNRRSLEDMLNRTIARAKRGAISSLLYMDLDNFKEVNDNVGHSVGDEVLITLSDLLKAELRTEDTVFRLGGDEFAVLLEGMDSREALTAAERLRLVVEGHTFELDGRVFPLSLSIGLIEIEGTLTTGELLSQADAAMYRAKAQGKNRVVVSGPKERV
jgi:diguanylate cyclase (GGDEF)-like protein/PAS domain S-box-containing protein